jgi:hypothetical protein
MKKLECLTSAPARLSVAMPLIFGLATIAATPTVEAVTINAVHIFDGRVDVDQVGPTGGTGDNATNVVLWCNDAAPVAVNIISGGVDVTQSGVVNTADDLSNCDLTDENGGVPTTNQVDIINGLVDVNEDGVITEIPGGSGGLDDARDVQLFQLP